jgi:hypothetical protein
MNIESKNIKPIQFIRDLCKGKTEEELLEAEENFREYLLVVKEMCDRIELEGKDYSVFDEL